MSLSSGAKKELLVLFFAKSLIKVSREFKDESLIVRDMANKYHRENKKYEKQIMSLMDKVEATIDLAMDNEVGIWLKSKTNSTISYLLKKIADEKVQLDILALYIMYVNFCERNDKKLDSLFEQFTDSKVYFDNIDLLLKVGIKEDDEAEMFNLAYFCLETMRR